MYKITAGIIMATLLAPSELQAASGVLLPKASSDLGLGGAQTAGSAGSSSGASTLGLLPSVSPKPATPPPEPKPESSSPELKVSPPLPVPSPLPRAEQPAAPPANKAAIEASINALLKMKTNEPEPFRLRGAPKVNIFAGDQSKLPKDITITFSKKSILSEKDVRTIQDSIGYSLKEISSKCSLSAGGMIITNAGKYPIQPDKTAPLTVKFDGEIYGLSLQAKAVCLVDKSKPLNGAHIMMFNDRYFIPLHFFECPPPARSSGNVTVVYNGTPFSACYYH